jgi:pSer/pThr/pTyr-binding forkhead associated (FHA) protein
MNNKTNIRLGRGHDSDIRINDISVSRFHAVISFENNEFFLQDNTSKFGTLVEARD